MIFHTIIYIKKKYTLAKKAELYDALDILILYFVLETRNGLMTFRFFE